MLSRHAVRSLSVALLIGAGLFTSVRAQRTGSFAPFVPTPLPERATGDFDGDGRLDVARIDDAGGDRASISVHLSGSAQAATLSMPVAALIENDIDRDGDLDLLATTVSGELVVWVNDGHGRFTRRMPSETHSVVADAAVRAAEAHAIVAVTTAPPLFSANARVRESVIVTKIRPPTAPLIVARQLLLLYALRAPPVLA